MRNNLMVQEQINSLLLGVTYKKRESFFDSPKFEKLLDCLVDEDTYDDLFDEDKSAVQSADFEGDTAMRRQKTFAERDEENTREYWRSKLINYLTKSNEQWILDQFNLCKRFVNQNSIEGHFDDFRHSIFNRFKHILTLRKKIHERNEQSNFNNEILSGTMKPNTNSKKQLNVEETKAKEGAKTGRQSNYRSEG